MTRVLATSALGASSPALRVRARIPAPTLESLGVEVRALPLFTTEEYETFQTGSVAQKLRITMSARRRLLSEAASETAQTIWMLSRADMYPGVGLERRLMERRRMVYDVDDAIWHDAFGAGGGHRLAFLKGSRRKAAWLARRADHVVAGNSLLAEWLAERAQGPVTVVPSLVDTDRIPTRRHSEGPRLVIGWIGSPTTAPHLERLVGPMERLAATVPQQVCMVVIGGTAPRMRGVDVEERRWSEADEGRALQRMDIGVMPLPDNRWTRGKCAYKAIQYMAAGVPVVAPDVGVTADVVGHEAGRIASDEKATFEALRELSSDPDLRDTLGRAGRARAEQSFSVRAWAPRLALILTGED
jgi:glycosyltransferase involved in cell wall biosynthesis